MRSDGRGEETCAVLIKELELMGLRKRLPAFLPIFSHLSRSVTNVRAPHLLPALQMSTALRKVIGGGSLTVMRLASSKSQYRRDHSGCSWRSPTRNQMEIGNLSRQEFDSSMLVHNYRPDSFSYEVGQLLAVLCQICHLSDRHGAVHKYFWNKLERSSMSTSLTISN